MTASERARLRLDVLRLVADQPGVGTAPDLAGRVADVIDWLAAPDGASAPASWRASGAAPPVLAPDIRVPPPSRRPAAASSAPQEPSMSQVLAYRISRQALDGLGLDEGCLGQVMRLVSPALLRGLGGSDVLAAVARHAVCTGTPAEMATLPQEVSGTMRAFALALQQSAGVSAHAAVPVRTA